MGRYISGDIEGKMWVGVQSSYDPDFFGGEACEPQEIEYSFYDDNIEDVEVGLIKCLGHLGENKKKLDDFFEKNNCYNEEMIAKQTDIPSDNIRELLIWYSRFRLGEKIYKKLREEGQCHFTVEV